MMTTTTALDEYRKNYERGWRASARATDGSLHRADLRGEPDAWYDGYLDYATGRPKWTTTPERRPA